MHVLLAFFLSFFSFHSPLCYSFPPVFFRMLNAAITLLEKWPEKNSSFERDSSPQPLRYSCNALPTELSKPHESGRVWVRPFMFSGRTHNTRLKYI